MASELSTEEEPPMGKRSDRRGHHIHTPLDGRGELKVLVDGKEVKYCYYADTKRGIARCYRYSYELHKYRILLLTKTYRGNVHVS
jgi:hypothetical protein